MSTPMTERNFLQPEFYTRKNNKIYLSFPIFLLFMRMIIVTKYFQNIGIILIFSQKNFTDFK